MSSAERADEQAQHRLADGLGEVQRGLVHLARVALGDERAVADHGEPVGALRQLEGLGVAARQLADRAAAAGTSTVGTTSSTWTYAHRFHGPTCQVSSGAPTFPKLPSPGVLRSPHDRRIFALAIPALGALAAEPLYVLVDTAIVGHLGTTELAALAIAATVLTTAFTVFNFLTYGTTAHVARLHGAGREKEAALVGSQALWLSLAIGLLLLVAVVPLAPLAVDLMGGEGEVARQATLYLRLAALGAPFFMLSTAGQGYLRGIEDLKTPLKILVAAHAVNVVLELLFVYGFDWGLAGSAWGTVIAQAGMGAAFVVVQRRAGWQRPEWAKIRPLMRIGAHIAVRTTALLGSFLIASRRARARSRPRRSAPTRSRSSCSCSSRSCSTRWPSRGR